MIDEHRMKYYSNSDYDRFHFALYEMDNTINKYRIENDGLRDKIAELSKILSSRNVEISLVADNRDYWRKKYVDLREEANIKGI